MTWYLLYKSGVEEGWYGGGTRVNPRRVNEYDNKNLLNDYENLIA